jgi:hypothetical protein
MSNVSTFRLYLLRAGYLLIAVGVGVQLQIWPAVMYRVTTMELMHGVVTCMLCALSVLAVLGIRYPLQMLPLLFWEIAWKTIWLLSVALRQWSAGGIDPAFAETTFACLWVVIFVIIVPWSYVFENYVKKAGDPWRSHVADAPLRDSGNAR